MSPTKHFLAPPPLEPQHSNEGSAYSISDTAVSHDPRSRTPSGLSIIVPDSVTVTSPAEYNRPMPHSRPTFSRQKVPPVIPPPEARKGRTLVLCFDGTGDQFDLDNSNVVQFVSLLQKDDKAQQMVYYQV